MMTLNEKIKATEDKLLKCKNAAEEASMFFQLSWLREQKKKDTANIADGLEKIMSDLKGCDYRYITPHTTYYNEDGNEIEDCTLEQPFEYVETLDVNNDVFYYLEKAIEYLREESEDV